MALSTTRMNGLRKLDDRQEIAGNANMFNQMARPVRNPLAFGRRNDSGGSSSNLQSRLSLPRPETMDKDAVINAARSSVGRSSVLKRPRGSRFQPTPTDMERQQNLQLKQTVLNNALESQKENYFNKNGLNAAKMRHNAGITLDNNALSLANQKSVLKENPDMYLFNRAKTKDKQDDETHDVDIEKKKTLIDKETRTLNSDLKQKAFDLSEKRYGLQRKQQLDRQFDSEAAAIRVKGGFPHVNAVSGVRKNGTSLISGLGKNSSENAQRLALADLINNGIPEEHLYDEKGKLTPKASTYLAGLDTGFDQTKALRTAGLMTEAQIALERVNELQQIEGHRWGPIPNSSEYNDAQDEITALVKQHGFTKDQNGNYTIPAKNSALKPISQQFARKQITPQQEASGTTSIAGPNKGINFKNYTTTFKNGTPDEKVQALNNIKLRLEAGELDDKTKAALYDTLPQAYKYHGQLSTPLHGEAAAILKQLGLGNYVFERNEYDSENEAVAQYMSRKLNKPVEQMRKLFTNMLTEHKKAAALEKAIGDVLESFQPELKEQKLTNLMKRYGVE